MANFTDFVRNATAAFGAVVITGAVVVAAAAPAASADRQPTAYASVAAPVSVQARA